MNEPSVRQRLAALAAWESRFEAPGFSFGHWEAPPADDDGVRQMPYFSFDEDAFAFLREIGESGWIEVFDWMSWSTSGAGATLLDDRSRIATVGADDLARLLTTVVRSDRFSEGALASALESGLLLAIVRRASVLAAGLGATDSADEPG